ncbi:MAG: ribosome biogenesis GTPase Der [Bacteroidia bacterium]|nr:ribosome biogenesis GTPase Der [Bacteroidia bacterium]MDW8015937.1 ribosome biogenesis GTPase Der [Bacteroidia bacterium]
MRKVALVGRTNVGKSTLFNQLIGRRQAIVENKPGVTRDRHTGILNFPEGGVLLLIDTGGFFGEGEGLEAQVAQQVRFAVEEADLLLWIVDGETGLLASDEEFGAWLRRYRKADQPLWLVVNKVDNPLRAIASTEFHRLGIAPLFLVSATTGQGIQDLKDALKAFAEVPRLSLEAPRFALIGRPNVGKSSLLNALLKQPRAIVSDTPGTTRDPLYERAEWQGRPFYWVDTGGLRRKSRIPRASVERYAALRSLEALFSAEVVLLVTDATEALTAQDMTLLRQAEEHGRGIVILLNKKDLLTPAENSRLLEWARRKVLPLEPVPILLVSALTGHGIRDIPAAAFQVYDEGRHHLSTRLLNDTLLPILRTHPHPSVGGLTPSIRFVQQIGTAPPTFLLHARHARKLRQSYLLFLQKQIRKIFPFTGWHIRFQIKEEEKLE